MSQRRQANLGGYNDPFRDPFGDPFFGGGQDPFAAMMQQQEHMMMNMNRMIGGMLGGFGGFGGAMGNGSNLGPGHSMLMNDASSRSTQRLPARSSSGPIVEEPDSEPVATSSHYRGGLDAQAPAMSSFSSSSFSSSSFSGGGGSGPVYFQSSTSTIRGPNGIVERTHSVRDSRSGIERTTMQRGMGDRARQISMERDSSGVERQHELLTNIRDEEKDAFDAEWEAQARGFGLPSRSTPSSSAHPRIQRSHQKQIGNGGAGGR